jgi:diguanylate cyclase (GGDEF)-like protein/PAS domain S-box-containing protein
MNKNNAVKNRFSLCVSPIFIGALYLALLCIWIAASAYLFSVVLNDLPQENLKEALLVWGVLMIGGCLFAILPRFLKPEESAKFGQWQKTHELQAFLNGRTESCQFDTRFITKEGKTVDALINIQRLSVPEETPLQLFPTLKDVSDSAFNETKTTQINHFYAALSQCNQAIVRSANQDELFPQLCRDAVNFGAMKMAWVGLVESETRKIIPVASYGNGGQSVFSTAFKDGDLYDQDEVYKQVIGAHHSYWCQDLQFEVSRPSTHTLAKQYGWRSAAILPLFLKDNLVATFNLYAGEPDAFDEGGRLLLEEMATDISYALNGFELEAKRKKSEQALRLIAEQLSYQSGADFFQATAKSLIQLLHADYVLVGELLDDNHATASVAMLSPDGVIDNFQYALAQTPCAEVFDAGICVYPSQVSSLFPNDTLLCKFKIQAYAGIPLFDGSGLAIGLIIALWRSPLSEEEQPEPILHIFSARAGAELMRTKAEALLRKSNDYLDNLFNYANAPIVVWDPFYRISRFNHAFEALTGISANEMIGQSIQALFPPDKVELLMGQLDATQTGKKRESVEIDVLDVNGFVHTLLCNSATLFEQDGITVMATITQGQDITERHRLQKLEETRSFLLESISKTNHLGEILTTIANTLERFKPGTLCSILLLDEKQHSLNLGAAPSLPDFYNQAIEGLKIGLGVGSCGTTAFTGRRTIVEDVSSHVYWTNFRELTEKAGLGSCWSEPIIGSNQKVLGTFAIYQRAPSLPDDMDIALIETAAHVTSIAIERIRAETRSKLASKIFLQSTEGFIVADANCKIVMVNQAFSRITGFSEEEAIGQNPRLFAFGTQDEVFYQDMWSAINTKGYWEGEVINRRKDGSLYPEWLSVSRVVDDNEKVTEYIAMLTDISERKATEEHILKLAHFDTLTGLPNRTLLHDRAEHAISMAKRYHTQFAVMFIDLDHFKNINDSLGHRVGDELLVQVAQRMKASIRGEDTLARPGGDEFILIVLETHIDGAMHVAEKLLSNVAQSYQIDQFELMVTLSIGIAIYPDDGTHFQALCRCADTAMYRVKRGGRNNYRFFTAEMQAHSARTLQLENAMRKAIDNNQLFLHYQPQISLQTGWVVGAEALIRWQHPELGLISPAEFIPIAEDSGQIIQIGTWVLRTAIHQLKSWLDSGLSPISVAVNLSTVQFRHLYFSELVAKILDEAQLPSGFLELELTESVAMEDPLGAIAIMNRLNEAGIRMSIDDFGTGLFILKLS